MNKILPFITLFMLLCASIIAQTDVKPSCPKFSMSGPRGIIVEPGETATYIAEIDAKGQTLNIEYIWSISGGKIISGQGTPTLAVEQLETEGLQVTVVIKGFPDGCTNAHTETAAIKSHFNPLASDEFGKLKPADERGRLDAFLSDLNKEPDFNGYIVSRFPKSMGASVIRKRIKRMKDHIFTVRKIPKDRVVILVGSSESDSTVLWLLPPAYGKFICQECRVY